MAKAAVFLDRDDTLIENIPYLGDPSKVRLVAGAAEGCQKLIQAGYPLFVVSNQSGVGRGWIDPVALERIHAKLDRLLLEAEGFRMDAYSICPHRPEDGCICRKPKPELLLSAARSLDIDLSRSFMIGDRKSDYEAGVAAGVKKSYWITPGDEASFREAIREISETGSN